MDSEYQYTSLYCFLVNWLVSTNTYIVLSFINISVQKDIAIDYDAHGTKGWPSLRSEHE